MGIYATVEQLREYGDQVGGDDADLEIVLGRAERDIDRLLGPWPVQSNGRKMGAPSGDNTVGLEAWQIQALANATCAQAEYRITMGEDFFVRGQAEEVAGPDFRRKGKLPYYGPKVRGELDDSELRITGARLGG